MPNYIINKNADENNMNEVHRTTCAHLPYPVNQVPLGFFNTNKEALAYAKRMGWNNADGCKHCCPDIHHG